MVEIGGASPPQGMQRSDAQANVKTCLHEVAWPDGKIGTGGAPPPVAQLAHTFPFELDPFQRTSINALEAGDSVLVSAHTSAGKTVVAQYAIAMALRDKTRVCFVIYTSPLKALSNQKYKEFVEEFTDVGLMTGDITINPDASCLVLTTEILRSMLYHCSEVVAEARIIIFDEIHYIKDKERGLVWEEAIILLPDACQSAFLSATIPNALEFAQWVANIHKKKCHVVYTDFRPVPLQHFIMPCGGEKAPLYCVVDKEGRFQESSFQKAMAAVGVGTSKKGKEKKQVEHGETSEIFQLVRLLMERNLHPVIVFALSKRQCEQLAMNLAHLQVNSVEEAKLVDAIFWSAMDILPPQDRALPQVTNALPMLRRGIGVHHSGLLPIVKEAIEVLFAEGLIKVLFATETFSTGLNMPAHTVVFAGVRKFDGDQFRNLSGAEYIQMSGRAGRRGLDDTGTVVLMCDSHLEPPDAKAIVKGAPEPLHSAFHLAYSSLLSTLRLDKAAGTTPEMLIKASLKQFQAQVKLPSLRAQLHAVSEAASTAAEEVDEGAKEMYHLLCDRLQIQGAMHAVENLPRYSVPFLQPGRLVRIAQPTSTAGATGQPADHSQSAQASSNSVPESPKDDDVVTGQAPCVWGVVVSFQRMPNTAKENSSSASQVLSKDLDGGPGIVDSSEAALEAAYIVDVLAAVKPVPPNTPWNARRDLVAHDQRDAEPLVVTVPLTQLAGMSTVRVMLPKSLLSQEEREAGMRTVKESILRLEQKYKGSVPMLSPTSDLKISSSKYKKLRSKMRKLEDMIEANDLNSNAHDRMAKVKAFMHYENIVKVQEQIAAQVKEAEGLVLKKELQQRLRVLRRLGYINDAGIVLKKGHVAANLSTGHALVLTELLMHGALSTLTAIQATSVLSCFVWSEASDRGTPKIRDELQGAYGALREAAKRVGQAQTDAGMPGDVETFINSFRPDLMDMVTLWASGARFSEVKQLGKSMFEGSIVRAIRRLHELLIQMKTACDVLGDTDLAERMEVGASKLKRDVVFAASLYL